MEAQENVVGGTTTKERWWTQVAGSRKRELEEHCSKGESDNEEDSGDRLWEKGTGTNSIAPAQEGKLAESTALTVGTKSGTLRTEDIMTGIEQNTKLVSRSQQLLPSSRTHMRFLPKTKGK